MGCNCGGSSKTREPPTLDLRRQQLADRDPRTRIARPATRRSGGPGQAGYTWDGPPGVPTRTTPGDLPVEQTQD